MWNESSRMVTQDPRAGYRVALWQATNAVCIWGAAKLGFQPLSSASRIDFAIPCSGPESGSLAEEAAAGHWALQVPAQLTQPLGRVCCLHPGCTHQSGAVTSLYSLALCVCFPASLPHPHPCLWLQFRVACMVGLGLASSLWLLPLIPVSVLFTLLSSLPTTLAKTSQTHTLVNSL